MEKEIFNGQVLSEKEMKALKGGGVFEVTKPSPKCCPYCQSTDVKFITDTTYKYYCGNCGAQGVIDEG